MKDLLSSIPNLTRCIAQDIKTSKELNESTSRNKKTHDFTDQITHPLLDQRLSSSLRKNKTKQNKTKQKKQNPEGDNLLLSTTLKVLFQQIYMIFSFFIRVYL